MLISFSFVPLQNRFNFTCKATGLPSPSITFYRSGKNEDLFGSATPESLGWRQLETSLVPGLPDGVVVTESYDTPRKQTIATLILTRPEANSDYHCVARNQYSYEVATVLVDDFPVTDTLPPIM